MDSFLSVVFQTVFWLAAAATFVMLMLIAFTSFEGFLVLVGVIALIGLLDATVNYLWKGKFHD